MHYKKSNQEQSGEAHHKLFAYRRSEKLRPFHNAVWLLRVKSKNRDACKNSTGMLSKWF
jgi:hypothetical protein